MNSNYFEVKYKNNHCHSEDSLIVYLHIYIFMYRRIATFSGDESGDENFEESIDDEVVVLVEISSGEGAEFFEKFYDVEYLFLVGHPGFHKVHRSICIEEMAPL